MAKAAPVTRPSGPQGEGGGGKKIMGLNRTTVFVVGGAALGLGLVYFYLKGKNQPTQGQGGQGTGQAPGSPTGLRRQDLVIWVKSHGGHKGKGKGGHG